EARVLTSTSTAEASAQVARGEIDAAVSAPLAAQLHGLDVLADDIADNAGAVTRFALVCRPGRPPAPTGRDRTSIAATTQNRPGALLGVLTELAVRGIDLTRIESRPIKDRHAEYWFHLDCTGHIAEPAMGEALAALHRRCDRVRFLGSYPRAGNGASNEAAAQSVVPLGASGDSAFTDAWAWVTALREGTPPCG
ncbi:MAG: ACT domain-containing protein, partial [Pseudonocardia sp.]|nr:ACT domain-containing protein [Pseudonocardia sp.]